MDLHLLMLGKTGAGKSATGNSILGHKAFESAASMTSVTFRSRKDVAEQKGKRKIYVVDTPGIGDTGYSVEEGRNMFLTAIGEAISMSPYGYDALLLVYRFGERFTNEMKDNLQYLRQQFGEDFIRKYTIVVVSGGDTFANDEGQKMTFTEWWQKQTGGFREMLEEVQGRVILFNNSKRCKKSLRKEQRRKLFEMVEKLTETGRYTDKHFQQAQEARAQLLENERIASLSDEIRDETSLIITQFEKIERKKDEYSTTDQIVRLKQLEERILRHKEKISEEKNKNELLLQTQSIVDRAHDRLTQRLVDLSAQKAREEEEKQKQDEASRRRIEQLEREAKEAQEEATRRKMEELLNQERRKIQEEADRRRMEEDRKKAHDLEEALKKVQDASQKQAEEFMRAQAVSQKQAQEAQAASQKQAEDLKREFQQARDKSNGGLYGDIYGAIKGGLSDLYSWWKG